MIDASQRQKIVVAVAEVLRFERIILVGMLVLVMLLVFGMYLLTWSPTVNDRALKVIDIFKDLTLMLSGALVAVLQHTIKDRSRINDVVAGEETEPK